MTNVVVLGANGQVGAEICLMLRNLPDLQVFPVCRNPGSSSFLRYHGVACRHGVPADPAQAPELLRDADLVLNFAFVRGLPSTTRRIHADLIENSFRYSPPGAHIVFFSTMSVYGFPSVLGYRRNTAYGREKLYCERVARRESVRAGKPLTILRLGHVCGELQTITNRIRREVASGPLSLRDNGDYPSNTVYTATIVESVLRLIQGDVTPQTYDLVSPPHRSWRQVYAYEAGRVGVDLQLVEGPQSLAAGGVASRFVRWLMRVPRWSIAVVRRSVVLSDLARTLISRLPDDLNRRLSARHNRSRAQAEIARLVGSRAAYVPLTDPWRVRRTLPGLSNPADLYLRQDFQVAGPVGFSSETDPVRS